MRRKLGLVGTKGARGCGGVRDGRELEGRVMVSPYQFRMLSFRFTNRILSRGELC